jgi:hypothetical protein
MRVAICGVPDPDLYHIHRGRIYEEFEVIHRTACRLKVVPIRTTYAFSEFGFFDITSFSDTFNVEHIHAVASISRRMLPRQMKPNTTSHFKDELTYLRKTYQDQGIMDIGDVEFEQRERRLIIQPGRSIQRNIMDGLFAEVQAAL